MGNLLYQNAEKILKDFSPIIDVPTYVKLKIILFGKTQPKEIKGFLNNLAKNFSYENLTFSHEDLVNEINLYQKRDNKKIQRLLQSISTVNEEKDTLLLIEALHLKSICKAILTKYPMPSLAGLPYVEWTPGKLRKYLCLYFNIKQPKLINRATLTNYINDWNTNRNLNITSDFYRQNFDLYYVYLWATKLPKNIISKYRKNAHSRRYNRIIFIQVFALNQKSYNKIGNLIHRKYNAKNRHHSFFYTDLMSRLTDIVDKSVEQPAKKPLFIFDTGILPFSNINALSTESLYDKHLRMVLKTTPLKKTKLLATSSALFTHNLFSLDRTERMLLPSDFEKWKSIEAFKILKQETICQLPYNTAQVRRLLP